MHPVFTVLPKRIQKKKGKETERRGGGRRRETQVLSNREI